MENKEVRRLTHAAARGMTLLEIMVVVLIISLIASVVGVGVMGRLEEAKRETAMNQIREFEKSLEFYKLNYNKYPTTSEGLNALTTPKGSEKPIMKSVAELGASP